MSNLYNGKVFYSKKEKKEHNLKAWYDEREYRLERLKSGGCETPGCSLLDSSLISTTNSQKYTHKIIECGEYYQVYNFYDYRVKKEKEREKFRDDPKIVSDNVHHLHNSNKDNESVEVKNIEVKNILRSKNQMQRLIKTNETIFKSFMTLTFGENICDITLANQKFKNWKDTLAKYLRKQKKEFLYVCVPEFQKRGAAHFHLLTNLDLKENSDIIILQKGKKNQYDVKYWNNGYSSVFSMKDINVVGYLTKYMSKDIDSRLWGKRRYLYSLGLKQPSTIYIDENNTDDNSKLLFIELFSDKKYDHVYLDKLGQAIEFIEYKRKDKNNYEL